MISLDDAVIARYQRDGLSFEILVDPEKAREFKQDKSVSLDEVVAANEIYADSGAGKKASDSDLNKVFGSNAFKEVAEKIIEKGEIQLTTEQKRKMQLMRKKQLVSLISRGAVDPRTHTPHPASRIEKALDEARIHVDPFKSAESQMDAALKALKPIMPIKMEKVRVAVKVSAQYSGPVCGFMKNYKLLKEQWGNDGSYMALLEMPAGLKAELLDKINKMTHGEVQSKITETI